MSGCGKGKSRKGGAIIAISPSVETEIRGVGGVAGLFEVSSDRVNWVFGSGMGVNDMAWMRGFCVE